MAAVHHRVRAVGAEIPVQPLLEDGDILAEVHAFDKFVVAALELGHFGQSLVNVPRALVAVQLAVTLERRQNEPTTHAEENHEDEASQGDFWFSAMGVDLGPRTQGRLFTMPPPVERPDQAKRQAQGEVNVSDCSNAPDNGVGNISADANGREGHEAEEDGARVAPPFQEGEQQGGAKPEQNAKDRRQPHKLHPVKLWAAMRTQQPPKCNLRSMQQPRRCDEQRTSEQGDADDAEDHRNELAAGGGRTALRRVADC
mmetsp:Transcript_15986/g.55568  ORF Transcript_15986/g.55568 Transcript_15986/m.55568 type:complete len:256 (+) Transcript_15986:724-1491(+)